MDATTETRIHAPDTAETFLRAIELTPVDGPADASFEATTQYVPWPKAYGGDMTAQATAAMQATVGADRALHSLHSYFMRPVDIGAPVRYDVETLRDGRGYSTRSVRAVQNDKIAFTAMGSFHVPEEGPEFQQQAPAVVEPETLRTAAEALDAADGANAPARDYWAHGRSFDMRHVPGPVYVSSDGTRSPSQAVWVRAFSALPDAGDAKATADLHRTALAYVCDYTILETLLRVRGLDWSSQGLATASLDHAMWFHRAARADDWILYAQDAVSMQDNRGLALGRFFDRDGRLLATVAQEGMIRG